MIFKSIGKQILAKIKFITCEIDATTSGSKNIMDFVCVKRMICSGICTQMHAFDGWIRGRGYEADKWFEGKTFWQTIYKIYYDLYS